MLIDSGEAIARRVKQLLNGDGVESAVLFEGEVFCSAPSIKEEALNHTFKELNFSSLQCLGYPKF